MSRYTHYILYVFVFLLLIAPANAADNTSTYYKKALAAIAGGNPQRAEDMAAKGKDPVLNKVIRGYAMALPGNNYTFQQLNSFIENNPEWPGIKDIRMIAEQKIPSDTSPSGVANWFLKNPPLTLVGFYRYIDALDILGQTGLAREAIKKRWIEGSFSENEQAAFVARFSRLLDRAAMWARTDNLLWRKEFQQARRMKPYLGSTDIALTDARIGMAQNDDSPEEWMHRLPSDATNDAGFTYLKLRYYVKNNRDYEANNILLSLPADLPHSEEWWEQRHIMARRAIEKRDFVLAYSVISYNEVLEAKNEAQREFLCGWLALRFLNRPDIALTHFQRLRNLASTPITKSRGYYWMGRTYEALQNRTEAIQSYEEASVFQTTFYGQLATTRINKSPVLSLRSDPPIPSNVKVSFLARSNIAAIEKLHKIGEKDRAISFFKAAMNGADRRSDFSLLTEVATRINRPDMAIQTIKTAAQKNIFLENGGFPILPVRLPASPEPAFIHALIRQESMFNPTAASPVGARGLMQLMPATAREEAKKLGIKYQPKQLDEPSYNVKLGSSFAERQINSFNGSYILALAGYNAGPRRVRDWIREFGDPRSPSVDPIDWIELMPISETRNYVQRIMESLQVYRARLAGGKTRLILVDDLRR